MPNPNLDVSGVPKAVEAAQRVCGIVLTIHDFVMNSGRLPAPSVAPRLNELRLALFEEVNGFAAALEPVREVLARVSGGPVQLCGALGSNPWEAILQAGKELSGVLIAAHANLGLTMPVVEYRDDIEPDRNPIILAMPRLGLGDALAPVLERIDPDQWSHAQEYLSEAMQSFQAWLAKDEASAGQDEKEPLGFRPTSPTRHSVDFTSVHWFGTDYTFSKTQAACLKVLWEAWEQKTPVLSEETILEQAGSAGSRLRDVFKSKKGMHEAWGTMIIEAGKGRFRLKEPEKTQPPAKPQENPA